jgi:hypothetical protein
MRRPSDVDDPIDQGQARALILRLGIEIYRATADGKTGRNGHRAAGLLVACGKVYGVEPLIKRWASRIDGLRHNIECVGRWIDHGRAGDAYFGLDVAFAIAN